MCNADMRMLLQISLNFDHTDINMKYTGNIPLQTANWCLGKYLRNNKKGSSKHCHGLYYVRNGLINLYGESVTHPHIMLLQEQYMLGFTLWAYVDSYSEKMINIGQDVNCEAIGL